MLYEPWRKVSGDRLERRICIARIQVGENAADAVKQAPAALESFDRVDKPRRPRRTGNCVDFGLLLGHSALKGRWKMLRLDAVERRDAERCVPVLEEWIFDHFRS